MFLLNGGTIYKLTISLLLSSLFLVSCGLQTLSETLKINGFSSAVDKYAGQGTQVGNVDTDSNCTPMLYKLVDDFGGLFTINDQGQIFLTQNNPTPGTYHLKVKASCGEETDTTVVVVTIPVSPKPWFFQLGNNQLVPKGTNANDFGCIVSAADSQGNLYCAGFTRGDLGETSGGGEDAFVFKVDPSGDLLWVKQFGANTNYPSASFNTSGNERVWSINIDSNDQIYLSGYTTSSMADNRAGSQDIFFVKMDKDGGVNLIKQYGQNAVIPNSGSTGGKDYAWLSKISGDHLITFASTSGSFGETAGGSLDVLIFKSRLSDGEIVWAKQLGSVTPVPGGSTSSHDEVFVGDVDSSGNIYFTGRTKGALGEANGGHFDSFVGKIDSNGNLLWLKQFGAITAVPGGSTAASDESQWLELDSNGQPFVVLKTKSSLGEAGNGSIDVAYYKLDQSGNLLYMKQLGSVMQTNFGYDTSQEDTPLRAKLDQNKEFAYLPIQTKGDLFEANGGNSDVAIIKVKVSDGSIVWKKQFGADTTYPAGLSAAGNQYALSTSINPTTGNIYVVGVTDGSFGEPSGGGFDSFIIKFLPDGTFEF